MQAKSIAPPWYSIDFSLMSWNGWQYWREELPICRKPSSELRSWLGTTRWWQFVCAKIAIARKHVLQVRAACNQPTIAPTTTVRLHAVFESEPIWAWKVNQTRDFVVGWKLLRSIHRDVYFICSFCISWIENIQYTYRIALWYRAERLQRGNFCMDPCLIDILINISFNTVCNGVCMELPYMDVNTLESRSCLWFSQL